MLPDVVQPHLEADDLKDLVYLYGDMDEGQIAHVQSDQSLWVKVEGGWGELKLVRVVQTTPKSKTDTEPKLNDFMD